VARFNAAASADDEDAAPATDLGSLMATLPAEGGGAARGSFMKGDKVGGGGVEEVVEGRMPRWRRSGE
jgi:transcription elongation factor SPT5